jgi:hypothetical protein
MPEGEPEDARVKDRISYSNSICQTDLTYVSIPVSHPTMPGTALIFRIQMEVNQNLHSKSKSKSLTHRHYWRIVNSGRICLIRN